MIRCAGRCFKVHRCEGAGRNSFKFDCEDLETKQNRVFTHEVLGMFDAMTAAARVMKPPEDTLLIDIDTNAPWKIVTKCSECHRVLYLDERIYRNLRGSENKHYHPDCYRKLWH